MLPNSRTVLRPPAGDILIALCRCVRAFLYRQIAEGYFHGDRAKAIRKIATLEASDLIVRRKLLIRDIGSLDGQIFSWVPGDKPPRFQAIVGQVRRRWVTTPTKVAFVVLAGPRAQSLLGYRASGSLRRPLQASHDLGLAEAYLAVLRDRPAIAKDWKGEDVAPKQRGSVPDAMYIEPNGATRIAFEFCGLYSANRLQAFHRHCEERKLSYELW